MVDQPLLPPDDPEDWSDEQWLTWLQETDALTTSGPGEGGQPVPPAAERLPVSGQLLFAGMRGLFEVIYGKIEQPAIVIEASGGDPEEPESVEINLDPDHPEDSTVVVRPWLMEPDA
jgi:hypothetical protein